MVPESRAVFEQGVLQFVLHCRDKGLSSATISGKIAGVSFYASLFLGFDPTKDVLISRVLKGWGREKRGGRKGVLREAITFELLVRLLRALPGCCYDSSEVAVFRLCMVWMFFGAFRVSELLGTRWAGGRRYEEIRLDGGRLGIWLGHSKTE